MPETQPHLRNVYFNVCVSETNPRHESPFGKYSFQCECSCEANQSDTRKPTWEILILMWIFISNDTYKKVIIMRNNLFLLFRRSNSMDKLTRTARSQSPVLLSTTHSPVVANRITASLVYIPLHSTVRERAPERAEREQTRAPRTLGEERQLRLQCRRASYIHRLYSTSINW